MSNLYHVTNAGFAGELFTHYLPDGRPASFPTKEEAIEVAGQDASLLSLTKANLRAAIEPVPAAPQHLLSVRGTGYRLES